MEDLLEKLTKKHLFLWSNENCRELMVKDINENKGPVYFEKFE